MQGFLLLWRKPVPIFREIEDEGCERAGWGGKDEGEEI